MNLNLSSFQEPRGFIKLIQIVFAIISFATTCDYHSSLLITIKCSTNNAISVSEAFPIEYPFNLPPFTIKTPTCPDNNTIPSNNYITTINLDNVSKAQFFVTIGVMAFLYTLVAIAVYSLLSDSYATKNFWPTADLMWSGFFVFMFFVSSIAWSTGVSSLKVMTDVETFKKAMSQMDDSDSYLLEVRTPPFAKLTISLVTGYFNIFLWAASMWFTYKETEYHIPKPFRPTASPIGGDLPVV